ncbi:hypothetical protein H257_01273 [Aphanomyces astaci]|uniref:Uncharacterized protein n=1 Tax=Aphanomyces astaci TaxID=112090 RepID=W4H972_APHAT|nr:hypothetical protein H257_01273 [Aphanomyces astaci]ETV87834.1 hypothetical protein H257_01273 [Aphanomyces astaci]|eukprot:XP_009822697.1 hypothetical protein H257_01273 [Aphanomyces astaci]
MVCCLSGVEGSMITSLSWKRWRVDVIGGGELNRMGRGGIVVKPARHWILLPQQTDQTSDRRQPLEEWQVSRGGHDVLPVRIRQQHIRRGEGCSCSGRMAELETPQLAVSLALVGVLLVAVVRTQRVQFAVGLDGAMIGALAHRRVHAQVGQVGRFGNTLGRRRRCRREDVCFTAHDAIPK